MRVVGPPYYSLLRAIDRHPASLPREGGESGEESLAPGAALLLEREQPTGREPREGSHRSDPYLDVRGHAQVRDVDDPQRAGGVRSVPRHREMRAIR